jgi:hypothetical protein
LAFPQACSLALDVLGTEMMHNQQAPDREDEEFRVLRKGLAYCWSVAVASCPQEGKQRFESWLDSPDKDIRWIMRENLKKKQLWRMDAEWVTRCQGKLATPEADGAQPSKLLWSTILRIGK